MYYAIPMYIHICFWKHNIYMRPVGKGKNLKQSQPLLMSIMNLCILAVNLSSIMYTLWVLIMKAAELFVAEGIFLYCIS